MIDNVARKLNYQFNNPKLLKQALTHRSYGDENNERLEFLGDSIVNFVIAQALYQQFPEATEGELSRLRAALVNRETLGNLGRHFDLGRHLFLGTGELKSGGSERESIISCAMESIIGAIYLDGGFDTTRDCIMSWYKLLLSQLTKASGHKDPKTTLQEYLQKKKLALPVYKIISTEGEAHQQIFKIRCVVAGVKSTVIGTGTSRRRAEQEAAELMLEVMKK